MTCYTLTAHGPRIFSCDTPYFEVLFCRVFLRSLLLKRARRAVFFVLVTCYRTGKVFAPLHDARRRFVATSAEVLSFMGREGLCSEASIKRARIGINFRPGSFVSGLAGGRVVCHHDAGLLPHAKCLHALVRTHWFSAVSLLPVSSKYREVFNPSISSSRPASPFLCPLYCRE